MSNAPKNSLLSDVRIRERNLKRGLIQPSDVEQHLNALPDVAAQAETLPLGQPALGGGGGGGGHASGGGHEPRPAPAAAAAVVDEGDDDEDDEDDDDDEE
ncbi:MAG TPA: hypothetical protein VFS00_06155 [Polyangiaceae bacterium]|nr:hypothetical protein [Polyangiaceae bacterium]